MVEPAVVQRTLTERVESAASIVARLDRLCPEDERELGWYLRSSHSGPPSSFGAQLEKLAQKTAWAPCLRCGGRRRPRVKGTGRRPMSNKRYSAVLKDWRRRELEKRRVVIADGIIAEALRELGRECMSKAVADEVFRHLPEEMTRACKRCAGTGMVNSNQRWSGMNALTARPTGSSKRGGAGEAATIPEPDLERCGRVSARLRQVRMATSLGARALELYYSGNFLSAVHEITPAGAELLKGNKLRVSPERFFANLEAEIEQGDSVFRSLGFRTKASTKFRLMILDKQARELVAEGSRAWNRHGPLAPMKGRLG